MSRAILKYAPVFRGPVPIHVDLPVGAQVVHVASKEQLTLTPAFWADVDTEEEKSERRWFVAIRTAEAVPEDALYVGTAGEWHVWEVFPL